MLVKQYRTGWISDVHLGTRGSNALRLLEFLRAHRFETLYIVGDLVDVWSLRRGIYWPQTHNDVIQKILRAARKGTRVIYIPGNHDDFLSGFVGSYGAVTIARKAVHTTADGRRILVMHGHELDAVVQNVRWIAIAGDVGYQLLLKMNGPLNAVRRLCGLPYWSLSAFVKQNVKNAVSFISHFEEAIVRFARTEDVHGVLCGHIHCPAIRTVNDLTYYNSGDWVESASAIVEQFNGKMELIKTPLALTLDSGHAGDEADDANELGDYIWSSVSQLRGGRLPSRYHE